MTERRVFASGLTLTEASIALAVIGLVVLAAIPMIRSHLANTKSAKAIADIRVMWAAIKIYRSQNTGYPESLRDIGYENLKDPWGNGYVYVNFSVDKTRPRRTRNLRPINSYFDLYSFGADRVTKTSLNAKEALDDIIIGRDGEFIGRAEDY